MQYQPDVVECTMTSISRMLSGALLVGAALPLATPAGALPLGASLQLRDASTPAVQTIQWRHGWGGGHWGHRGGWGWGGVGLGFAAGALIGSALAAPYYPYGYYAPGYYAFAPAYAPPYYAYGFRPRVHVRHYRHYRW
jgi:hypothetical protein